MQNIVNEEINVAGSGTSFECWYHGKTLQTRPTFHTMETCVVTTWLKLNYDLLKITGNPFYANNIETAYYNALMASTRFGGSDIEMYSPLEGYRGDHNRQCNMDINCCVANGPRGYVIIPRFAIMTSGNKVFINLYTNSTATFKLNTRNQIRIVQKTTYPEGDKAEFIISVDRPEEFTLAFRIPQWSIKNSLSVNGEKIGRFAPGSYAKITRKWKTGDKINLQLDLRGRIIILNNNSALLRGPIVLARDSRFNDGFVDEAISIQEKDGISISAPDYANKIAPGDTIAVEGPPDLVAKMAKSFDWIIKVTIMSPIASLIS